MVDSVDRLVTEAEQLCEAATEGPWEVEQNGWTVTAPHANVAGMHDGKDDSHYRGGPTGQGEPNATFIARARTLVPELASALRGVVEERDRLRAVVQQAATTPYENYSPERNRVALHRIVTAARDAIAAAEGANDRARAALAGPETKGGE